jgi:hypothetical protein
MEPVHDRGHSTAMFTVQEVRESPCGSKEYESSCPITSHVHSIPNFVKKLTLTCIRLKLNAGIHLREETGLGHVC